MDDGERGVRGVGHQFTHVAALSYAGRSVLFPIREEPTLSESGNRCLCGKTVGVPTLRVRSEADRASAGWNKRGKGRDRLFPNGTYEGGTDRAVLEIAGHALWRHVCRTEILRD